MENNNSTKSFSIDSLLGVMNRDEGKKSNVLPTRNLLSQEQTPTSVCERNRTTKRNATGKQNIHVKSC